MSDVARILSAIEQRQSIRRRATLAAGVKKLRKLAAAVGSGNAKPDLVFPARKPALNSTTLIY